MNDNQYQDQNDPAASVGSETAQTPSAGGSGDYGTNASSGSCCQKMMAACKDMCNRFMSARVGISYDITTRIIGGEGQGSAQGNHAATQKGQSPSSSMSNAQGQQGNNTMTKQGELELRVADLTIGAMMLCAVMSVMCAIKGMCCGKGCCKCKRKH